MSAWEEVRKTEGKEKLTQIYEIVADMTLSAIKTARDRQAYLDRDDVEMIRVTQSLYECINASQSHVYPASATSADAAGKFAEGKEALICTK